MKNKKFNTRAIRQGYHATEQQEHSVAVFLTSSFTFDSAEQAANRFANEEEGNIYTRFTNPNVQAFEDRLAGLEEAESCIATASGMSAIFATLMGLLKAGDHIVASRDMFGTTIVLLNTIVNKFNIEVTFVDLPDINSWRNSVQANTKIFLLETPSNPLGEVVDLALLSALSKKCNILLAVDNCIMTPALQKPLNLGADLVIHSATKYIDGQGRCLAGAVAGRKEHIDEIRGFCRATGPTLSAFNAWVMLKGLETLSLRMKAHCDNAIKLAEWLQNQGFVQKVHYLGLQSHPHHDIAKAQQSGYGVSSLLKLRAGKRKRSGLLITPK